MQLQQSALLEAQGALGLITLRTEVQVVKARKTNVKVDVALAPPAGENKNNLEFVIPMSAVLVLLQPLSVDETLCAICKLASAVVKSSKDISIHFTISFNGRFLTGTL